MTTAPTDNTHLIAALLAPLTKEERTTFQAFYDAMLAEWLEEANAKAYDTPARAADPDMVEAAMVAALFAQTNGQGEDGMCFVPLDGGRLYRFTPSAVGSFGKIASPPYGQSPTNWKQCIGLLGLVGVMLITLFRLLPVLDPAPTAITQSVAGAKQASPPSPTPLPAGAPASDTGVTATATDPPVPPTDADVHSETAFDPTSLEIATPARLVFRVVPSSEGSLGGVWQPTIADGQAAWLIRSVINPIMCIQEEVAPQLLAVDPGTEVLIRLASGSVLPYEVFTAEQRGRQQTEVLSQRQARATIIACGGTSVHRVVVTAIYRPDIAAIRVQPDATSATIDRWIRVEQRHTATEDYGGQVHLRLTVSVTNLSQQPLAITELTDQFLVNGTMVPTLLLPRMDALQPQEEREVTYGYVIRKEDSGKQAVWQVLTPDGSRADLLVVVPDGQQVQEE